MGMTTGTTSVNGCPMQRLLLALGLFIGVLLRAAEPTVDDRLKALEQQVQQLAHENSDLKKQLGFKDAVAPVLLQPAGHEAKFIIGGLLQGQAEFGGAADPRFAGVRDRFYFRRARLYVAGSFTENFDFKAEMDLQGNTLNAAPGQLARANEVYINWRKFPAANVRFGQLKTAFGGEALTSDSNGMTIERSLSSDRLVDGRQLGVSVLGELPGGRVHYTVLVANGSGANSSANDNSKFQRSARVVFTALNAPSNQLTIGVDGLWTDDSGVAKPGFGFAGNVFTGRRAEWGVDADWKAGEFELAGEWLQGRFEPVSAVPAAHFTAHGWQVTAGYFLVPHALQAIVRREAFDPNTSRAGDDTSGWTVGLNYLIKGNDLRLMVDYLLGRGPGSTGDTGRLVSRFQIVF